MTRRITLVVALTLVAAGCGIKEPAGMAPLKKPDDVQLEPATTVVESDLSDVELRGVKGSTTTSVVLGPGKLTMTGRVVTARTAAVTASRLDAPRSSIAKLSSRTAERLD